MTQKDPRRYCIVFIECRSLNVIIEVENSLLSLQIITNKSDRMLLLQQCQEIGLILLNSEKLIRDTHQDV